MLRRRHGALALLAAVATSLRLNPAPALSRRQLAKTLSLAPLVAAAPALALNPMVDKKKSSRYDTYYDEAPSYLAEPTAEFKQAEKQRAEYRAKQAKFRAVWDPVFAAFQGAKDDDARIKSLRDLQGLIRNNEGLPSGLRLTDFITLCRRVKANALQKNGWGTPVEIAYMDMVREIKKAENPNQKEENFL